MFLTEIYTFRIFIRIVYVAFLCCLLREGQCVVFFPLFFSSRGARGHAVVMVRDPFSDLPLFW